jgi:hypothetical protein
MREQTKFFAFSFFFFASILGAQENPQKKGFAPSPTGNKEVIEPVGAITMQPKAALLEVACAERKKLGGLVKVYVICARSPEGQIKDWDKRIESARPFMLSLDFTYNVGGKRAAETFAEALPKTQLSPESAAQKDAFLAFVTGLDVKKKTRLELHFAASPEVKLEALFFAGDSEAQRWTSQDTALAKAVAGIWLGENGVDPKIQQTLLK